MDMAEVNRRLSDAELEIMQAIWGADGPLTSSEVQDALRGKRNWALSTLMTVLARLCEKGFVLCDRSTRTNYYSGLVSEREYKASEGRTLLEKLCGNSLRNLVTSLHDERAVSEDDLSELREYLNQLKEGE